MTSGEPKTKELKARNKLDAIDQECKGMKEILEIIYSIFSKNKFLQDFKESSTSRELIFTKELKRIEFIETGLKFYIDFSIKLLEEDNPKSIVGCITYGLFRESKYRGGFIMTKVESDGEFKLDREENPLLNFTVNGHGLIIESDKLDDEWILIIKKNGNKRIQTSKDKINNSAISELHTRAIARIWKEALDWTNENLLP